MQEFVRSFALPLLAGRKQARVCEIGACRGHSGVSSEKKVLACTAFAAAGNVILNLIWIPSSWQPRQRSTALVSYVVFLVSLALAGRYASELGRARTQTATAGHNAFEPMQE